MIQVTVDATQVLATIDLYVEKVNQAIGAALYQGGEAVLAESKKQVPVRTGVLMGSGTVFVPEYDGRTWTVQLGYGGAAELYAWQVHEDMTSRHKKGKKAKYLSDPFYAMAPAVVAHLQAAVAAALT